MRRKSLTIAQKKGIAGFIFLLPVILGLIFLFILPLIDSLRFSFSLLTITDDGFDLTFIGWDNFNNALRVNPDFNRHLVEAMLDLLIDVPIIIILSFLFASILNQQFRGRALARAVFFLPVILASGAIAIIDGADFAQNVMRQTMDEAGGTGGLQAFQLESLLLGAGLDSTIVGYLTGAVDRIYLIVTSMGVQLLVFLAGLQSIPVSLYEASKVEGATSYETFWLITFPLLTPLILTNVVYTVVNSFLTNDLSDFVREMAFRNFNFGLSAAMSWIYFLCIAVILFLLVRFISRYVYYQDAEK